MGAKKNSRIDLVGRYQLIILSEARWIDALTLKEWCTMKKLTSLTLIPFPGHMLITMCSLRNTQEV